MGDGPAILAWFFGDAGPDWETGALLFGIGFFGALVTAYLFLGDFLPAMGGRAQYLKREAEIEQLKKRRDDALRRRERIATGDDEASADKLAVLESVGTALQEMISGYERRQASEFWRLAAIGFPMYVLLGGLTAAAIATNLLQALIVGFAWPAVVDRLGLTRQMAATKELKDAEIDKLERRAESLANELRAARQGSALQSRQLETAGGQMTRLARHLRQTQQARPPEGKPNE